MYLSNGRTAILEEFGLMNKFNTALDWLLEIRSKSAVGYPPYRDGEPPSVTTTATALILLTRIKVIDGTDTKASDDVNWLISQQGKGWQKTGNQKDAYAWCIAGEQPCVWPTAWSVWALIEHGQVDSDATLKGIEYLIDSQDSKSGGWPCYFGSPARPIYSIIVLLAFASFLRKTKDAQNTIIDRVKKSIILATSYFGQENIINNTQNFTECICICQSLETISTLVEQKIITGLGKNVKSLHKQVSSHCQDFIQKDPTLFKQIVPIFESLPIASGWSLYPFHPATLPFLFRITSTVNDSNIFNIVEWFEKNWKSTNSNKGGWPDLSSGYPVVYATILSLLSLSSFAYAVSKTGGSRLGTIHELRNKIHIFETELKVIKKRHRIHMLGILSSGVFGFLLGVFSQNVYAFMVQVTEFFHSTAIEEAVNLVSLIVGMGTIISLIVKRKKVSHWLKRFSGNP